MLAELHQERCARAIRYKTIEINGITINYKEQPGVALGSIMWPGSIYLSQYLQKTAENIRNKSILELGSGIGVCSIISSKLGGKVLSTDKSDTLNLLKENSELNNTNLEIKEYAWGDQSLGTFDIIIGSDIVYYDHNTENLIKALLSNSLKNSKFILSYTQRHQSESAFFTEIQKFFKVYDREKINDYEIICFNRVF